jgi:peptide/nickel transport system substrate-binding protein
MRSWLAAVAAMTAAIVVLVGLSTASASVARNGATISQLRIGWNSGVNGGMSNFDYTKSDSQAFLISLGLEQLLQADATGRLQPWLATSWSQQGPTTYVYHLRHGVKFWDGNPFTSADVVFTWKYYMRPKSFLGGFGFGSVKSITAPDPYTVVVKLKQPDNTWKYTPANYESQIFEKKFYEQHKATFGSPTTMIMGTGPFMFKSLDPTRGLELVANPAYWGGKVGIDKISVTFLADDTASALAFRSGSIDLNPYITSPGAYAGSGAKLFAGPGCNQGFMSFPTKSGPWTDVHVRRAVAYALNRSALIKAYGGYAKPNYTFVLPNQLRTIGSAGAVARLLRSLPAYSFSLAKARAELAKSKYPHGFTVKIPAQTDDGRDQTNIVQTIAAELKPLGIDITVFSGKGSALVWGSGIPVGHRLAGFVWEGCNSLDPATFLGYSFGAKNPYNASEYAPAGLDGMISAAAASSNPHTRLTLYGKLLERLATDLPVLPLMQGGTLLAISPRYTWARYDSMFWNRSWGLEIKAK